MSVCMREYVREKKCERVCESLKHKRQNLKASRSTVLELACFGSHPSMLGILHTHACTSTHTRTHAPTLLRWFFYFYLLCRSKFRRTVAFFWCGRSHCCPSPTGPPAWQQRQQWQQRQHRQQRQLHAQRKIFKAFVLSNFHKLKYFPIIPRLVGW